MNNKIFRLLIVGIGLAQIFHARGQEIPGREISNPGEWVASRSSDVPSSYVQMMQVEFEAPQEGPNEDVSAFSFEVSTLSGVGNEADFITPEIQALADGLRHDPLKIYAYCRNKIRYEHYFGCKKGAALTLAEGSGNSFDTSALMVALLRASGHTAQYRYGPRTFDTYPFAFWLNLWFYGSPQPYNEMTDAQFRAFSGYGNDPRSTYVLRYTYLFTVHSLSRGFPAVINVGQYAPSIWNLPFVWVQFEAGGVTYEADPSYKVPETNIPIANVSGWESSLNYTRSTLLSDIGGVSTGTYASGLNEGALGSSLTTYTTHLTQWMRDTVSARNATVEDFIPRNKPLEKSYSSYSDIEPVNYSTSLPWLSVSTWSEIPTSWMTKLTITCGTGTYNTTSNTFPTQYYTTTLTTPSLMGGKLALTFSGNMGSFYLDDNLLSNLTIPASSFSIRLAVNHPHGLYDLSSGVFTDYGFHDGSEIKTYEKANSNAYVFAYGFDSSGRLLRRRQEIMDNYRRQGLADTSRQIRTEALNILGLNWLAQTRLNQTAIAGLGHVLNVNHHRFGRVAQESGYYIDFGLQNFAFDSHDGNTEDQVSAAFHIQSLLDSALEHGIVEQMQGAIAQGVSTIKVLQLANAQNLKVYRANSGNWSGGGGIRSQLSANGYSPTTLNSMETEITGGAEVLVPEQPGITLNEWTGTGYSSFSDDHVVMAISGSYSGGYSSLKGAPDPDSLYFGSITIPAYYASFSSGLDLQYDAAILPGVYGADPVDLLTGAFTYASTDLVLGGGTLPSGLTFSRHYNSNRVNNSAPGLGRGWTHNLDIRLTERSSPFVGLGGATPYQMAPYLASLAVAKDLFDTGTTAKDWLAASLAINWAAEQLRYKAVAVTFGEQMLEFVQMPDGTYEPPPGVNLTLSKVSGNYVLSERHGNTFTFDSENRLAQVTDQHGKTSIFTYTADKLTQVADCYNRTLTLGWTGDQITSVTDSTGRSVAFAYTGELLTSTTDAEGGVGTFQYAANNRISTVKDALDRTIVVNTYDSEGRVVEQQNQGDPSKTWKLYFSGYETIEIDPDGDAKTYIFDSAGRATGLINALGQASTKTYDGQDHLVEVSNALSQKIKMVYDARNNLVESTDPLLNIAVNVHDANDRLVTAGDFRGNSTTYTYNATHQVLTVEDAEGIIVTTNTYHADGNLATTTDAASGITSYAYDTYGNVSRIDYPDGAYSIFTYNVRGDLLQSMDPNGHVTAYTYNTRRQPLVTTFPGGATVENIYDSCGDLITRQDENGHQTHFTYTATGKLLTTTLPITTAGTAEITNDYDAREWLTGTTDPLGRTTTFTYDAAERVTAITDPLGRTIQQAYDAAGRRITLKNPLMHTTSFGYNARGERTSVIDPLNAKVTHAFDANGNQTGLENRRNNSYLFTYDANNRLLTGTTPLGLTTTHAWDDRGLPAIISEPSGDTATFTYDARGRMTGEINPDRTLSYTYDDNSNLLTVTSGTDAITRAYDNRNRLISYTDADGNTTGYAYDASGNLTTLTYPDGKTVAYAYDARNQLITVTDWASRETDYAYDLAGRLTHITRPNETTRSFAYDLADQVIHIEERKADGIRFLVYRFGYDLAGRITSEFSAPLSSYQAPPVNTITYDADNRIATFNGNAVTYDLDGNLTVGPLTSLTTTTYTYDALNRLTSAGGITYTYDHAGNRISVTDVTGTTRYILDSGGRVLIRIAPSGAKTHYVYGRGLVYEVNEAEETKTYHVDYRGSTVALTAADGQTVIDRFDYTPWGRATRRLGETETSFLYNGAYGVMTDANGLVYMRARYFNPTLMRFLNPDPSGFAGGINLYAYASGNPVSRLDPLGLSDRSVGAPSVSSAALALVHPWNPNGEVYETVEEYLARGGYVQPLIQADRDPVTTTRIVLLAVGGQALITGGPAIYSGYNAVTGFLATGGSTTAINSGAAYQAVNGTVTLGGTFTFQQGVLGTGLLATQATPYIIQFTNFLLSNPQAVQGAAEFTEGFLVPGPPPMTPAGTAGGFAAEVSGRIRSQ